MKNLWLKSRDKTVRSITPSHQEEQTSANAPGNQAADQMVDAAVKAPASAVYQAGKKLAQDTARSIKERREVVKESQAAGKETFSRSGETGSPLVGEQMDVPQESSPPPGPNRGVREQPSHSTISHTHVETLPSENSPAPGSSGSPRQRATAVRTSPKKAGKRTPFKAPLQDIKTATHKIKSARRSGKTAKTIPPSLSVTRNATQTVTRGSVRKAQAAARQSARTLQAAGAQTLGKSAAAAVKATAAAIQNGLALLLSGSGVVLLVVLVICLLGLVAGSAFGIFFSGEDTGAGLTIYTAIAQVNQEYQDKLEEIQASYTYDTLEITGSQAVWKDVLAVYAVKTTTDPEGQDVASMNEEKLGLIADVFWEMNQLTASVETRTETTQGEEGEAVETEVTVLVITVSHKSAQEMAEQLGFDTDQKEQLQELLSPDFDDLWNQLLYGIALGGGNGDLVAVAQSQVGNVGGTPYWSWYGFSSRVEWCAIFVSWCADQCGMIDSGAVPKFSGCGTGVRWFQSRGQWLSGSATPEPGMLIFFKWYGSDSLIADHVGIVERVENGRVYTIEGNSGDRVQRNSYPIGYGEILGYGTLS